MDAFSENDIEETDEIENQSDEIITENLKPGLITYFENIGQYDAIQEDEEAKLFDAVKQGDREAFTTIFERNLKLVVFIAKKYRYMDKDGTGLDDLIQEGSLGLMRAIETYDRTVSKFSTYAIVWIKHHITRYVANKKNIIRVPVHISEKFRPLMKDLSILEKENGTMTYGEVFEYARSKGYEDEDLNEFLLQTDVISTNEIVSEGNRLTGGDFEREDSIPSDSNIEDDVCYKELKVLTREVIKKVLTAKEADIIIRRFGLNGKPVESLMDVAKSYGVTREAIRQTQKKALDKLYNSRLFNDYKDYER